MTILTKDEFFANEWVEGKRAIQSAYVNLVDNAHIDRSQGLEQLTAEERAKLVSIKVLLKESQYEPEHAHKFGLRKVHKDIFYNGKIQALKPDTISLLAKIHKIIAPSANSAQTTTDYLNRLLTYNTENDPKEEALMFYYQQANDKIIPITVCSWIPGVLLDASSLFTVTNSHVGRQSIEKTVISDELYRFYLKLNSKSDLQHNIQIDKSFVDGVQKIVRELDWYQQERYVMVLSDPNQDFSVACSKLKQVIGALKGQLSQINGIEQSIINDIKYASDEKIAAALLGKTDIITTITSPVTEQAIPEFSDGFYMPIAKLTTKLTKVEQDAVAKEVTKDNFDLNHAVEALKLIIEKLKTLAKNSPQADVSTEQKQEIAQALPAKVVAALRQIYEI